MNKINFKRLWSQGDSSSPTSGGVTPIVTDYSTMNIAISNNTATEGFYLITDATSGQIAGACADLGILVQVFKDSTGTARIRLEAEGVFLNPDFPSGGDYSGVEGETGTAYTGTAGVWNLNAIKFNYTSGGGSMDPEETITNVNTGATGKVKINTGTSITLIPNDNLGWNNGDLLNDTDGDEATITSVSVTTDFFPTGNVIFWNGYHYQVLDQSLLDGVNPSNAVLGLFTRLDKLTANVGYIVETDFILYDFAADYILWRYDKYGNIVNGNSTGTFQFGNGDSVDGNNIGAGCSVVNINQRGGYNTNTFLGEVQVSTDETHEGNINSNTIGFSNSININVNEDIQFSGNALFLQHLNSLQYTFDPTVSNVNGQIDRAISTFYKSFNITGETILDMTNLDYVGRGILASTNLTESISSFVSFPDFHPIRFYPESGLVLTFVHGTGTDQPRCEGGVSAVLNGTNGDWIEFTKRETFPGSTIFVIEQTNIATF